MENMKIGSKIKNNNGYEYTIIDKINNSYLLMYSGNITEYIVATNISVINNAVIWDYGSYFSSLKSATEYFYN